MMDPHKLYELAQIREQEYMLSAVMRRTRASRQRHQGLDLVGRMARRVYRRRHVGDA